MEHLLAKHTKIRAYPVKTGKKAGRVTRSQLPVYGYVRYADDFVMVFEQEEDARRVLDVLPKRFGKYGLALHPDKTRLLPFRQPPFGGWPDTGDPAWKGAAHPPRTFDFLGFTFAWTLTRRGGHAVFLYTAKDRLRRTVKGIHRWLRDSRHSPIEEQHATLCQKLRGHMAYFGVTGRVPADYIKPPKLP